MDHEESKSVTITHFGRNDASGPEFPSQRLDLNVEIRPQDRLIVDGKPTCIVKDVSRSKDTFTVNIRTVSVGTEVYATKDVDKGGFGNVDWFGRKRLIAKALKGEKGEIVEIHDNSVIVRWYKLRKNGKERDDWVTILSDANLSLEPLEGKYEHHKEDKRHKNFWKQKAKKSKR